MTPLSLLSQMPLIASVQASEGSPLDDPAALLKLAQASVAQGVKVLRLQGVANISAIRPALGVPVIGLIKRTYPGSDVYITATSTEVRELLALGCEVIALDGTSRPRPNGEQLGGLIAAVHAGGALCMADCDSLESAKNAAALGADFIGTTLAGYTAAPSDAPAPDLELVRAIAREVDRPVLAEGRYADRSQVESALRAGATAVVVGGALHDPVKQTLALTPRHYRGTSPIGAVDIGGTWLRFATFSPDWTLQAVNKEPNPHDKVKCIEWIASQVKATGVARVGVSTAGIVDPSTGVVWTAKEHLMPNHVGIEFSERTLGVPTLAWGDGHATAWAHACLPQFAGRRVATIAIGTGVGCGFVEGGRIWAGRRGEYPRVNDQPTATGGSYEDLLGGIHLTKDPSDGQRAAAIQALKGAIGVVKAFYFPDDIVIGGGVGLSDWLRPHVEEAGAVASPIGPEAGLYGAAALALFLMKD